MLNLVATATFVALLWGLTPVIHKYVLSSLSPALVMVAGSVFYMACVLVFGYLNRDDIVESAAEVTPSLLAWIAVAAVITGFLGNLIYLYVLKGADSYIVSALIYSSPAFTLIFAQLFLHEEITAKGLLGVLLIVAGVICISLNEGEGEAELEPAGAMDEEGFGVGV